MGVFERIREQTSYFIQHTFVRNFAILQVGNVVGNITQALVGIAFARILQPELYGVYALAFSLAGLLSIFLGIGAQDAVTTIIGGAYARKDSEHIREALAFLAKVTMLTGVLALIGAAFAPLLAHLLYHDYRIGIYAGIVVVASVVSTTFYSFTTLLLQVVGRIKSMTALGLLDQLSRTLLALLMVLAGMKVLGIAIGHLAGSLVVLTISAILWRNVQRDFPVMPSIRSIFRGLWTVSIRKYLGFSFWIAVDRNLSNLYNILPIFLTGIYVLPGEVTYFKLAFGYMNLALSFLGPIGTLLNVEFPKMQVQNRGRLAYNFVRISLYASALSLGLTVSASIVSPIVFRILYGTQYLPSIPYVFGLFLYGTVMGIGIGLGSMLRALNRVLFSIRLHVVSLAVGIPLGIYLIRTWELWGTVAIVTLWYGVNHIVAFLYVRRALQSDAALTP